MSTVSSYGAFRDDIYDAEASNNDTEVIQEKKTSARINQCVKGFGIVTGLLLISAAALSISNPNGSFSFSNTDSVSNMAKSGGGSSSSSSSSSKSTTTTKSSGSTTTSVDNVDSKAAKATTTTTSTTKSTTSTSSSSSSVTIATTSSVSTSGETVIRPIYATLEDYEKEALFRNFADTYGRMYKTDEYDIKFDTFKTFLDLCDARNMAEEANGGTAIHGVTMFADLTPMEYEAYLGFSDATSSSAIVADSVPVYTGSESSVDWTDIYTTPVKDQGYCGSCWAFSAVEQIESDSIRQWGVSTSTTLSAQQIVSCDSTDAGCSGGDPELAYAYVQGAGGVDTESDYPYTSTEDVTGTCDSTKTDYSIGITGFYSLAGSDATTVENNMIEYVKSTGPLSVCIDATEWSTYTEGVISLCSSDDINHCVQVVGVNTEDGYWKVRNSWGTGWGESGFIRLATGSNMCGITFQPTYTDTFKCGETPQPSMHPTWEPSEHPTWEPTEHPVTEHPTWEPTPPPETEHPTYEPTLEPEDPEPTHKPTHKPTKSPDFVSYKPTHKPTFAPDYTHRPTKSPDFVSYEPTYEPTISPTVPLETDEPSASPTHKPTRSPDATHKPTYGEGEPTPSPTNEGDTNPPTYEPSSTVVPTEEPTLKPTGEPSHKPTRKPSPLPTHQTVSSAPTSASAGKTTPTASNKVTTGTTTGTNTGTTTTSTTSSTSSTTDSKSAHFTSTSNTVTTTGVKQSSNPNASGKTSSKSSSKKSSKSSKKSSSSSSKNTK